MNKVCSSALLVFTALHSFAQTVQRQSDEDAQAFINRTMPGGAALAHHIIETNRWSYPDKMVIACYGYNDSSEPVQPNHFSTIEGHVYMPATGNTYRDISFGPLGNDDTYPEIVSIFFVNADADTAKEMVVLCSYPTKDYDFEGIIYKSYIFDNPAASAARLTYLEDLSRQFFGMEGKWRDGKINIARYKTAKEIRAKLRQMGYKQ